MRLAINAVGIKGGGGGVVLREVLDAAARDPAVEQLIVFASPRASRDFPIERAPKIVEVECALAETSRPFRVLWHERLLEAAATARGVDGLLCLCGMGRARRLPYVSFVQQALPFSREALQRMPRSQRMALLVMKRLIGRSCHGAAGVFVQTRTMADCLAQSFGLSESSCHVFTPAARRLEVEAGLQANAVHPMDRYQAGERLLYVGNSAGYKNLATLVAAAPGLLKRRPSARLFLTIAADHPLCSHEGVVGLGVLNERMLASAYARATALVMPSLVETVGLPLLEAMSLGVPILAADRPYAREMCGDAAAYFDPLSPASFVRTAEEVLSSALVRERLRMAGCRRVEDLEAQRAYDTMIASVCRLVEEGARLSADVREGR